MVALWVIPSHSASATISNGDIRVVDGKPVGERVLPQQIPPHVFNGTAKIDGAFAPSGTVITALIDGFVRGRSTVEDGGIYTLLVNQGSGTLITFMIGNLTADQNATWEQGGGTALDLTASSQEPHPTPTPPATATPTPTPTPVPIHACFRNHQTDEENQGQLRVVSDPTKCKKNETALSWNQP